MSPSARRTGGRASPMSPRRLVFIDETGAKTNMARRAAAASAASA